MKYQLWLSRPTQAPDKVLRFIFQENQIKGFQCAGFP